MSDFQIDYSLVYDKSRQDAAFYIDDNDSQVVACVICGDEEINIERVGEMKVYHPDGEYPMRYTDQLFDADIKTDADLANIELEWDMNPWFELYYPKLGQWLDVVAHEVDDAIEKAKYLIESGYLQTLQP